MRIAAAALTGALLLSAAGAASGFGQKKPALSERATPRSDAEIEKCIADRLAASKLKDDGITATVSGGRAALGGRTKIAGHKGTATQFARRCGAKEVTNNIVFKGAKKGA